MRPVKVTAGPLVAASANNIALSQSISGATAAILNGTLVVSGVAILDKPRQVLITSAGNDSGITFTIVGTTFAGAPVSEVVTGGNIAAVASKTDFATVTSITSSASTAAAITIGTNGVAGSAWVKLDEWALGSIFLGAVISGTANFTVQTTQDDPNSPTDAVAIPKVDWETTLTGNAGASNIQYALTVCPEYARVLLNSGSGSVTLAVTQAGVAPY